MASDGWRDTTIGDLLASHGGSVKTGPFGTTLKAREYSGTGVPLISVGEIGYGSLIVHGTTPRAPREVVERLPEYVLEAGDIVFGRKGAVDRCALVRPEQAGWFLGSDGIRLRLPKVCDARFIAYQLQSRESRSWLLQHATGTTMASLNQSTIERLPVVLPPLTEQRAIAHILGTLDDKIGLNRRMNETLEAMARAHFKSWFVDFDPVRAKAEGRNPGLPQSLADLFPDSFEDSEQGEIPRGWQVGTLGDLSTLNPESWSKESRPVLINYVDLSNTKWGRIEHVTTYAREAAPTRAQRVLRPRDTIVGTVRPGNRSYALISDEGLTGSTGFAVLRPTSPVCTEFIYIAATAADNVESLAHLADGGAYPAVRPEVVAATQIIKPRNDVLVAYSAVAKLLLGKWAGNERQCGAVAALRDALLPKLISGELRVKNASRVVSHAFSC